VYKSVRGDRGGRGGGGGYPPWPSRGGGGAYGPPRRNDWRYEDEEERHSEPAGAPRGDKKNEEDATVGVGGEQPEKNKGDGLAGAAPVPSDKPKPLMQIDPDTLFFDGE
jgi:hypothetical protein